MRRGIRIVAIAGRMNPRGCADALRALAARLGLSVRLGVVEGDDLMAGEAELRAADTREMSPARRCPRPSPA